MKARARYVYWIVLGACTSFLFVPTDWFGQATTLGLIHSMGQELMHGNLNGVHTSYDVPVDFDAAEPGDIILCHNARGAYGYWTHAVLYVGDGQAVDADDFSKGTILQDASHYRHYDRVVILRPKLPAETRLRAAKVAKDYVGTPYDPFSALQDDRSAYCSKLIWEAYTHVGVTLWKANGWVLPDDIGASQKLAQITAWGPQKRG